jgi:hypothetical protein
VALSIQAARTQAYFVGIDRHKEIIKNRARSGKLRMRETALGVREGDFAADLVLTAPDGYDETRKLLVIP